MVRPFGGKSGRFWGGFGKRPMLQKSSKSVFRVFGRIKREGISCEGVSLPKSRLDHATKKVAKVHLGFSCA